MKYFMHEWGNFDISRKRKTQSFNVTFKNIESKKNVLAPERSKPFFPF